MALRDWILDSGRVATANPAKVANDQPPPEKLELVAVPQELEHQSIQNHPTDPKAKTDTCLTPVVCTNCDRRMNLYFTGIHGEFVSGCLYPADGKYPGGWKRLPAVLERCMWAAVKFPVEIDRSHLTRYANLRENGKLSAKAKDWLHNHRQKLRQMGWTTGELYRRNKSNPGIAWLAIWEKPGVTVDITPDGGIRFGLPNNGEVVLQTARPIAQDRKN